MFKHLVVILTLVAVPVYLYVIRPSPKSTATSEYPVKDFGWRRALKMDGVPENLFTSRLRTRHETRTEYRIENGRRTEWPVSVVIVTNISNRPLYYLAYGGSGDASTITDVVDYYEELQSGEWVATYGGAGCGNGLGEQKLGPGESVAFHSLSDANVALISRRVRQWIMFSENVVPLPFQRARIESLTLLTDSEDLRK